METAVCVVGSSVATSKKKEIVWDLNVRIFHWSLTSFFVLAYLLGNEWPALHSHAGYTVILLILFRLLWGFWGSRYARFSQFLPSTRNLLRYLKQLATGNAVHFMGHNPAGSAMTVTLLTSITITVISGIMLFAMEGQGPLAGTAVMYWNDRLVVDAHHFFSDFTLVLVFVHVAGVLFTGILKRENLLLSMITGRKTRRDSSL